MFHSIPNELSLQLLDADCGESSKGNKCNEDGSSAHLSAVISV